MASIKYWNNNEWVDFKDNSTKIKKWDGESWVDGNLSNSPKINSWSGEAWVQLYPKQNVEVTTTFVASKLAYMHTSNSSAWTQGYVKGGTYESRDYTGWLNLKSPGIDTNDIVIKDITANYERNGVGSWASSFHMELSNSTLQSASGSGPNAHKSKITTFASDTTMIPCPGLSVGVEGVTTFNNANAKDVIKEWLGNSKQSLVYGSTVSGAVYTSLNALELIITYEAPSYLATFNIDEKGKSITTTIPILEDEINMSLDSILKRRNDLGIEVKA